jgi:hypothetical protein
MTDDPKESQLPTDDYEILRKIVLDLAIETKAPIEMDNGYCTICGGACAESSYKGGVDGHTPLCPYRRAVEYAAKDRKMTTEYLPPVRRVTFSSIFQDIADARKKTES